MSELGDLFKHPDKRLWLISLWEPNEYYKLLPNKIGVDKDWNFLVKFTKHNLFLFQEESDDLEYLYFS